MLLVLLAAMRFGFLQATVVSISSFLCLNFLFTEPFFSFSVADGQNWVALFTFEATALLVSGLSSKVRFHAAERARAVYRESRAQLERDAERLRTAVLDGLAHGFKTPLTAIKTASSGLLALDQLNTTQKELVSIIDERVTMLNQLTTRLLQTAAIEANEMRLRRSTVSLADVLQHLVLDQQPETRDRIFLVVPENSEEHEVDVTLIELALEQLVDNAIKYSAADSPVEITLRQSQEETSITVQNQSKGGTAIRPEERARIFERFYRGADALHGPAGTGLGLSIVKKAAEAHGGRAWVECSSEITRFTFAMQHHRKEQNG